MTTDNPFAPYADKAERDYFAAIVENERAMLAAESARLQSLDPSRWHPRTYMKDWDLDD